MSEEGRLYVLRPPGERKPVEPKPFPFPASKDRQQQFHGLDMWGKGTALLLRDAAQPPPEGQGSFSSGLVSDTYQHKNELITREGGGVFRLKCPSRRENMKLPPRGEITIFSAGAARRFRIRLGEVLNVAFEQAVLTTMTYPEELHEELKDWEFYKSHLKAYWMAFRREFPQASGFWKLEFQKNGRPHYHCILFGLGFQRCEVKLAHFIAWHSNTWFRVVGSGLEKHLNAGTRAEFTKHTEAARNYISQYAAKQEQQCHGFTGRYWGQINEPCIPWAVESSEGISDYEAVRVRRLVRKKVASDVKARRWRKALREPGLFGLSLKDEGWTPLAMHYKSTLKGKPTQAVWLHRQERIVQGKKFDVIYPERMGWHLDSKEGESWETVPQAEVLAWGDFKPKSWKWPSTYRPKNNESFVYLGDASKMKANVSRYLQTVPDRPKYEHADFKPLNLKLRICNIIHSADVPRRLD